MGDDEPAGWSDVKDTKETGRCRKIFKLNRDHGIDRGSVEYRVGFTDEECTVDDWMHINVSTRPLGDIQKFFPSVLEGMNSF